MSDLFCPRCLLGFSKKAGVWRNVLVVAFAIICAGALFFCCDNKFMKKAYGEPEDGTEEPSLPETLEDDVEAGIYFIRSGEEWIEKIPKAPNNDSTIFFLLNNITVTAPGVKLSEPFMAQINGFGHTITTDGPGLFTATSGANIQKLTVAVSGIARLSERGFQSLPTVTGTAIGVIAAEAKDSSFNNVVVSGDFSAEGYDYTGGLVGVLSGTSTLSKCAYIGSFGVSDTGGASRPAAGALVGLNMTRSVISQSYANAQIKALSTHDLTLGGLAGINEGKIWSSFYAGDANSIVVKVDVRDCASVLGALVGENAGSISECYANGDIFLDRSSGGAYSKRQYGGGLVGKNAGSLSASVAIVSKLGADDSITDPSGDLAARFGRTVAFADSGGSSERNFAYSGLVIAGGLVVDDGSGETASANLGSFTWYRSVLGWTDVYWKTEAGYPYPAIPNIIAPKKYTQIK